MSNTIVLSIFLHKPGRISENGQSERTEQFLPKNVDEGDIEGRYNGSFLVQEGGGGV